MPRKTEKKNSERSKSSTEVARVRPKRSCAFCDSQTNPSYTDVATLRRFVSDRLKIMPRARTGACSRHQRQISRNIKHARFLSLISFTPRV